MKNRICTRNLTSALGCLVLVGTLPASADVITTMSATDASRFFTDARDDPANLIGPGITEVNPSDVTSWTHENSNWGSLPNAGWFSNKGSTPIAFVEFDLGGTYTVSDAHIWNYNGSTDINSWNAVGVTLIFSEDATFGNGDDSSQNLTLSPASGLTTYTGEHFTLTSVADVTNIRLEITSAGGSSITGLSEVRFSGTTGPPATPALFLAEFIYDAADGSSEVRIEGEPSTRYKLVEAADLDFAIPDQDPIPLTGATVGTLTGDGVTTNATGDATVQFNLGTTNAATFLRAELFPE